MTIIKLHSTTSTNDYLKELIKKQEVENFTTVTAYRQENGRGQMGASWISEDGKNLIMSLFVRGIIDKHTDIFHLNVATSVSIFQILTELRVPKISIKWPNDIMAENKKVCGILIENIFKNDKSIESVIGIGINVNQIVFEDLPHATSLVNVTGTHYNIDDVLKLITDRLMQNFDLVFQKKYDNFWHIFHENLYNINVPTTFIDKDKNTFIGIIKAVSNSGKLEVQVSNDTVNSYAVKEIQQLL